MAAEEIMELFDQNWFFSKHKEPTGLPLERSNQESEGIHGSKDPEKPQESKIPLDEAFFTPGNVLVGRSMSDQNLMSSKTSLFGSSDDLFSPTSVLNVKHQAGKLQTILSGKEVTEFLPDDGSPKPEKASDGTEETKDTEQKKKKKHEAGRARRRKSLSDLEYQELKGFMDLGFVFSEEDHKDSDLVSILPGLQRIGRNNGEDDETDENKEKRSGNRGGRPYLSEAWKFRGERTEKKPPPPAMRWKFPAPANEVDMKDHLRLWAHNVASSVR
ncbi:PREDICTED: uncharacterized protein LOC104802264 [Tarenaya hassleriana]|uniref:uncharacterized protein LOC104802264 n=1 Tax=Tarenaya hassleriana TaxID=28532 RepID=UPI00053C2B5F|nr:PREDICTED: uncharacterized protein LOC104802264 [Tarenaya hassleriana]